jgi:glyoxylate/hydroxypyruvate reductase
MAGHLRRSPCSSAVSDRGRGMTFLYKANATRGMEWARFFAARAPDLPFRLLGQAVLERLKLFGFPLAGWNRSPRAIQDVSCYAGGQTLSDFLAQADILVCLLPLTSQTRGILNTSLFEALPRGAQLVNVGRGGHLLEADLIEALERGLLSAAVLDVAEHEPLPAGHPFWSHPRILLAPHIASMTTPEAAVESLLETIGRHRRGETLPGLVDRERGY